MALWQNPLHLFSLWWITLNSSVPQTINKANILQISGHDHRRCAQRDKHRWKPISPFLSYSNLSPGYLSWSTHALSFLKKKIAKAYLQQNKLPFDIQFSSLVFEKNRIHKALIYSRFDKLWPIYQSRKSTTGFAFFFSFIFFSNFKSR